VVVGVVDPAEAQSVALGTNEVGMDMVGRR
jgi:hypothetical protein